MRVLVAGREGQVAQALRDASTDDFAVTLLGRPQLDITDQDLVRRVLGQERPDLVVNAAAYTAVDKAETEVEAAFAVNCDGARHLAEAAAEIGSPIIHLSSDYVFPGTQSGAHRETDPTGPQNAYGRSKLAGERAVATAQADHAILRTSWVYGFHAGNFLRTMLRLASSRATVRVVDDQRGTPTYAPDIARAIGIVAAHLMARPGDPSLRGVFHLAGSGEASWAEFACEIFARSAERGGPSARVEPISTAEFPTPAKRPANSRLDSTRFRAVFGHALPDWHDSVGRCLDELALRGGLG